VHPAGPPARPLWSPRSGSDGGIAYYGYLVNPVTCKDGTPAAAGVAGRGNLGASERGRGHMVFKVGETVVYPHHGAALIEAIETRVIKGEEKKYLVLKVAQGDLTVRVPAANAEVVGVRDVVGQEGLDRVFEVLRAPHTEEPTNWSRRYKANLEKLASGDVNKVAEVVRDLWRRERDRGLSAGEKRMLAKARQILVSELALAEGTQEDKAEVLLDEVLAAAS
jgi:CarD family transcriptional regulator